MIEDFPVRLFLLTALLGGALVTAGALVATGRRPWSDWIMAAGGALTTLGLFLTTLVAFDLSEWLQRHGEYPCLGAICMGAMIFAVGFVVNQLRDRALARHQQQVRQIAGTPPPVPPHPLHPND